MADEPSTTDANDGADAGEGKQQETQDKTFTQADVDRVVSDRLRREREKFSDYDDVKSKASKLDEIEQANQSELEKANGKATELGDENASLKVENLRIKVALAKDVPADLIDRLRGETKEELEADADDLLKRVKPKDATDFDGGARKTERKTSEVSPGLGRLAAAYGDK